MKPKQTSEEIATALTASQRSALDGAVQQPATVRIEKDVNGSTLSALRRLGCVNQSTRALTPLGLAVREIVRGDNATA
ncbi:hypothetical protein O9X98_15455 [Agrobacterium salinitolerans]|nr:hypothetical protein [Agrobacterium salinitolerans]